MLEKDEGIVLRTARSGETSLSLTFLGRRAGKIRLLAKGVLRPGHPARAALDPGSHAQVLYYHKEGRTLFYMKEASLVSPTVSMRDSLPQLATVLAAVELLDQVCYAGAPDPDIVDLAVEFLRCAPASADPLLLFLAFELRLLVALGAGPDLARCARCGRGLESGVYSARAGAGFCHGHAGDAGETVPLLPETLVAASHLTNEPIERVAAMTVDARARKALGKILHWTYTFHVQGYSLPNSLNLI